MNISETAGGQSAYMRFHVLYAHQSIHRAVQWHSAKRAVAQFEWKHRKLSRNFTSIVNE